MSEGVTDVIQRMIHRKYHKRDGENVYYIKYLHKEFEIVWHDLDNTPKPGHGLKVWIEDDPNTQEGWEPIRIYLHMHDNGYRYSSTRICGHADTTPTGFIEE
jgi:hypothetical protein